VPYAKQLEAQKRIYAELHIDFDELVQTHRERTVARSESIRSAKRDLRQKERNILKLSPGEDRRVALRALHAEQKEQQQLVAFSIGVGSEPALISGRHMESLDDVIPGTHGLTRYGTLTVRGRVAQPKYLIEWDDPVADTLIEESDLMPWDIAHWMYGRDNPIRAGYQGNYFNSDIFDTSRRGYYSNGTWIDE
jgi:hypothetical protein